MSGLHCRPASEWLVTCSYYGFGATASLRQFMEVGHHDGEVTITADGFADGPFHFGEWPYELAFLTALAHHVRNNDIEPVCENREQEEAWAAWLAEGRNETVNEIDRVEEAVLDIPVRLSDEGRRRYAEGTIIYLNNLPM
ncbi:MAG: hypothetical protein AB7O59_19815 [Pirellulales bacterium]